MVLRQIRKHRHIHRQPPNPLLLQRMATTSPSPPPSRPPQPHPQKPAAHREASGVVCGDTRTSSPTCVSIVPINTHVRPTLRSICLQQKRSRRLPIRPRHRTQSQPPLRMPQHRRAHLRQRPSPMLHQRRRKLQHAPAATSHTPHANPSPPPPHPAPPPPLYNDSHPSPHLASRQTHPRAPPAASHTQRH